MIDAPLPTGQLAAVNATLVGEASPARIYRRLLVYDALHKRAD
jgi:hypothetical protein